MHRIKVAQVGTGHDHASVTFDSMLRQSDDFEVVGIAECNPKRVKDLNHPSYQKSHIYTVDELLAMDDLEAVAIESDESLATEYAQKFAERGVAVHLDKPGTAGVKSFEKLIETCRAQNLPLQMGYMYRYNPMVKKALQMAKDGVFGDIFSVEAHMSVHHPLDKRQWLAEYQGGMMYFLGCHLIDLILQIQGDPQEVIPMNFKTGIEDVQSEDYGFVLFKYPHGLSFIKTCSEEYNGFFRRQLVICGSKGTIEVKPIEASYPAGKGTPKNICSKAKVVWKDIETNNWGESGEDWVSEPFNRYDAMMHDFAQIVRGEKQNDYSYDYELKLFKMVMKCCRIEG